MNTAELLKNIKLNRLKVEDIPDHHLTEEFIETLASDNSLFVKLPKYLLSEKIIEIGKSHLDTVLVSKHHQPGHTYKDAALTLLPIKSCFLSTLNPWLVDDELLLSAIKSNQLGMVFIPANKHYASLVNDSIAIESIKFRAFSWGYHKRFTKQVSDEVFINGVFENPDHADQLVPMGRFDLLVEVVKRGFWPNVNSTDDPLAVSRMKPSSVTDAAEKYKVCADAGRQSTKDYLAAYVASNDTEEVLTQLTGGGHRSLLTAAYTLDQLRPFMKKFRYIRGMVLEQELGL